MAFLRTQEGSKDSPFSAESMLKLCAGCQAAGQMDRPSIEEEVKPQLAMEDHSAGAISVGPAEIAQHHRARAGRPPRKSALHPVNENESEVSCARKRRLRPRTRTSKQSRATADILLVNSSGRPQLAAALQACPKSVKVLLNQEHHAKGHRFVDMQYDADKAGWKMYGAQAVVTPKGGESAGTAIACRKGIGMGDMNGAFDHSPKRKRWTNNRGLAPDRAAHRVVVVSIYLHTNEGMTIRNRSLLSHAVAVAMAIGSPWIVGGDMNMSPEQLTQGPPLY